MGLVSVVPFSFEVFSQFELNHRHAFMPSSDFSVFRPCHFPAPFQLCIDPE